MCNWCTYLEQNPMPIKLVDTSKEAYCSKECAKSHADFINAFKDAVMQPSKNIVQETLNECETKRKKENKGEKWKKDGNKNQKRTGGMRTVQMRKYVSDNK